MAIFRKNGTFKEARIQYKVTKYMWNHVVWGYNVLEQLSPNFDDTREFGGGISDFGMIEWHMEYCHFNGDAHKWIWLTYQASQRRMIEGIKRVDLQVFKFGQICEPNWEGTWNQSVVNNPSKTTPHRNV